MLRLDNICYSYRTEEVETRALDHVSLEVAAGEFLALMGPSGCGKSTLLNILGLLDTPISGSYLFDGEEVSRYSEQKLTQLRRAAIGFIFQSFNLIEDLTVAENIDVALIYRGLSGSERKRRVAEALEDVQMSHRARHFPQQLSGGQQQRIAVARALVSRPRLILADEPTGNLDTANGEAVLGLLTEAANKGTTVIMATHSPAHAARVKRTVKLLDGHVLSETLMGT